MNCFNAIQAVLKHPKLHVFPEICVIWEGIMYGSEDPKIFVVPDCSYSLSDAAVEPSKSPKKVV